jgi:hypothetical protein
MIPVLKYRAQGRVNKITYPGYIVRVDGDAV